MSRRTVLGRGRGFGTSGVGLGVGLAMAVTSLMGCGSGDESPTAASGSSWEQPAAVVVVSDGENEEPVIRSLRFEPAEAVAGQRLRVVVDAEDPDQDSLEFGYTWRIDGQRMPSSGASVTLPSELASDASISVEVVASDGHSTTEPTRLSVSPGNRAPRVQELGIRVVPGDGDDLGEWVADPVAVDPDDDDVSFRYEWRLNGERVIGEEERLTRNGWKRGDKIVLTVWPSDGVNEGMPLEGAPFAVGNSPPDIVSRPPGLDASGRFVYQVEVTDRDGDRGMRFALNEGPDGMAIDPFSGALRWQATADDAGEHRIEIQVDDRKGGITKQVFFVAVEVDSGSSSPAAPATD